MASPPMYAAPSAESTNPLPTGTNIPMSNTFNFETDKNQIIARLILQKALMYVEATEGWLDDLITWHEADIVVRYTTDDDKVNFQSTYDEIKRYIDEEVLTPNDTDSPNVDSLRVDDAIHHLTVLKTINDSEQEAWGIKTDEWHHHETIDDHIFEALSALGE